MPQAKFEQWPRKGMLSCKFLSGQPVFFSSKVGILFLALTFLIFVINIENPNPGLNTFWLWDIFLYIENPNPGLNTLVMRHY